MKRKVTVVDQGKVEKNNKTFFQGKYRTLYFYYDTPQFYDQVMAKCEFALKALEEGYDFIDLDKFYKSKLLAK